VQDFLFDANHVTAFYNKDARLLEKLRNFPPERKYLISHTTRGELEAGHRFAPASDPVEIAKFWAFVGERFFSLELREDISIDTSHYYGEIIGRLHQKDAKKTGEKTESWLQRIGVQVNDVWFVAAAWSHNVVCLTHDRMGKIKFALGDNVRFDDWLS
jgi:predicted nucleic acid-binding protein